MMAKCSQCGASADRLYLLADWLDLKDAREGNDNHEVQRDLRTWATRIEATALDAAIASTEPTEKPDVAQAELCVLGSMILDPKTIDPVLPILKAEDFFYPANRIIFEQLLLMSGDGWEIGLATLNGTLANAGLLAEVGGTNYLMSLAEGVPSTAHAENYARIVRKHAELRAVKGNGNG